jgi:hypothetical protein
MSAGSTGSIRGYKALLPFMMMLSMPGVCWAYLGERFQDANDGAFDLSEHLLQHRGFLPMPILITEPAVGYGLGLAAVYFDESIASRNKQSENADRFAPPNITAVGGFKTENGSWGGGGGTFRTWDNDRFRYLGGVGKVDLNLDFYGPLGNPRSYQLEGWGLVQQLSMRLAESDWLLGGRYVFLHAESDFGLSLPEAIRPDQLDTDIGRLGLIINFDSRDNILTPSSGVFMEAEYAIARDWLGSSRQFENYTARAFVYLPLRDDLVLGLRADFRTASEGTPFFALPYIDLRGVPALRYQDRRSAMLESELRWNFTSRWALVGFAGVGRAFGRFVDFDEAESIYTRGTGIRYLIASKLGLYAGVDVARGPEERAFYIQLGSAWR